MFFTKRRRKRFNRKDISPDEIFLDAHNIPGFEYGQLDGRLEKPIARSMTTGIGAFFLVLFLALFSRIVVLQLVYGKTYADRASHNTFRLVRDARERGAMYDRNGEALAWNRPVWQLRVLYAEVIKRKETLVPLLSEFAQTLSDANVREQALLQLADRVRDAEYTASDLVFATIADWETAQHISAQSPIFMTVESHLAREYIGENGLGHVIGYLGRAGEQERGAYNFRAPRADMVGKAGIEKFYEQQLGGTPGEKLIETDSSGHLVEEHTRRSGRPGESVTLTIDRELSSELYRIVGEVIQERGFQGGAGVVLDVESGAVLALTSYPEYRSAILTNGQPSSRIEEYIHDAQKPFFNRAIQGLYAAGSVIKPLIALAALSEGIIAPERQILSTGSIAIPNPYDPKKRSVFYDWKAHGLVDMQRALAVSSNVYFFTIGGGFEDIAGLGITAIKRYVDMFRLILPSGIDLDGEAVGFFPTPEWKRERQPDDPEWRVGDTYNVSIGQGNVQVTPLAMALFSSTIANDGVIKQPFLALKFSDGSEDRRLPQQAAITLPIEKRFFAVVKEGMRDAVQHGTAAALSGVGVSSGAKTGTAEIGSGKQVHSWVIGFAPYEKPSIAFAIVLENGSAKNLVGAPFAARRLLEWMVVHTPQYLLEGRE